MTERSMNTAMAANLDVTVPQADSTPAAELFVINLCASMTPMPSVPKHLKGFERYKLYQVSKMEDGRRRYRLRLGFFTNEADAELIVGSIRNLYPAAFSSCLSNEDLRYIDGFAPRAQLVIKAVASSPATHHDAPVLGAQAAQTTRPAAAASTAAPVQAALNSAAPVPRPAAVPATPQSQPRASSPAVSPVAKPAPEKELSLEIDLRGTQSPPRSAESATKAAVVPFHVAKGVEVPDVSLELLPEAQSAPAAGKPPVLQQKTETSRAAPAAKPVTMPTAKATAPTPAAEPLPPPPQIVDYIPVLDTTLTLRTLTQVEIDDPNQPKWYVVQLAQSDHPVNLDAMPKLDIFSAYSLYSVAVTTNGTIRHALRLGFFREDVSAEAVSGYLKTFFASPSVTRVSTAEYTRFAEPPRHTETPAARAEADKIVQLKRSPAPKPAPKPAPVQTAAPAKSSPPAAKNAASAYAKISKNGAKPAAKSLTQELREEARQTVLSESGIRKSPKQQSFLSRLIGRSLD